ncbi:hypothetical protein EC973_005805 [Apophysomyces ossiformis]|uniref:Translation initiation factor IF2/IF5 domain-containing protein n=1 Tax=Apophysomyces ossiformis TaxID=679940 RepID=A0A8H7EUP9_9FUNG|nr:hypothetical protein EC973_005805 [Apophysomyces ossiformis]
MGASTVPHLSSDIFTLNIPQAPSPRREKAPFWSVKDKVLEPSKLLYLYRTNNRQQLRWFKLLLLLAALLFLASYIPSFRFVNTASTISSIPSHFAPKLDKHRNQIILYRIIGNDLPPRHKEGQTLSNLQFILEHEPIFPNTRKIFLLNRITDPKNEAAIIRLLNRYKMEYISVPFVEHEYQQLDFRLEDFPEPDYLHSDDYRRYSKVSKLRALDYTYHDKNLYAMNNNGGRNTALQHARSLSEARWIMPFDGNCYISQSGFDEIKSQLDKHGDQFKYFVVPMTRLLDNSVLLDGVDERPKTPEEPQIIFRYDAEEEYNLNMRYGRRSKLELLWRLGALENRRLNRPTVPWEPRERLYSEDKGNFRTIGWVFRLFSGNPQQEENKKEASSIRAFNRLLAIQSSLDSLDESIARRTFRQDKLFLYDEKGMSHIRYAHWAKDQAIAALMKNLAERADAILAWIQTQVPSSDNATQEENLSFLDASNRENVENLGPLSQNVTILTLANYFLGNERYGRWAANIIRLHFLREPALPEDNNFDSGRRSSDDTHLLDFLSDQGYSFPSLGRLPRRTSKYTDHTILNTADLTKTDMTSLLDCIRMLRRAQALTHKEYLSLQAIAAEFLDHLITSPTGIHLAQMTDHRGVLYDLQVTALAAFTDDVRLFLRVANRCRMRIGKQFLEDGKQPFEELATKGRIQSGSAQSAWRALLHFESLNLQYWTMLTRGIQNIGVGKDIWHYQAGNGARISHAVVAHLRKHSTTLSQLPPADAAFAKARLRPLAYMAQEAFAAAANISNMDQTWLAQHVDDFGDKWENPSYQLDINNDQGTGAAYEDQLDARFGVSPWWMLSSTSSRHTMSDKENEPVKEQFEDEEELDFSALKKKKKKSKKKVTIDDDDLTKPTEDDVKPIEDESDVVAADLSKKSKSSEDANKENADLQPTTEEGELDFGAMKKKKKKKKSMAEFEADLAEDGGAADEQEAAAKTIDGGEDAWLKSDRDYKYDELLSRVFKTFRDNNPELAGEKKKYTIVPPSIHREGNKKTIFANIADICRRMHRQPEHVTQYLFAELGTNGSVDGSQRLVIKGRFQQKQIENVLRRYIGEYVTCKTCKSPDTILTKDNRLYFVQCESCGSTRSVSAIKTGFKAQTKEDRRALRA